jgi:predicted dehydrogenase
MGLKIKPPVKVGVVGCGGVAQIIHLPILKKLKNVEVVALCDIDIRKASIIANRFGVNNLYDDIEDMFAKHQLDAVFILTPNNMHLPMSLIALRNGAHLFIEKPAGRTQREAQRIAASAQKHEKQVMVGMHTRFRHDMRVIKNYMDNHTIGELFFIKAEWLQGKFQAFKQPWLINKKIAGGGVLLDLGIQIVDTTWWMSGRPQLESVKVHTHQINKSLQVEDFCSFYLKFTNGLKVICHISWNFPVETDRFHAEVFGLGGSITLNPLKIKKLSQGRTVDATPKVYEGLHRQDIFKMAYEGEIKHFIDFLLGRKDKLESDIFEAIKVLEITDAIYESMKTGREVILQPDKE